jgi:para-aminobenzoate synthetase / 4-amino-4-deoxychorismate lyase
VESGKTGRSGKVGSEQSVLLESLVHDTRIIRIDRPERIIQTHNLSEVSNVLEQVDDAVNTGYLAAGFISYEAGFHFLPGMPVLPETSFPLVWFAITRDYDSKTAEHFAEPEPAVIKDLALDTTLDEYTGAIESIRREIEWGNTYQVNYTMRYRGAFQGSTRRLYSELRSKQRVPYAALIETPEWSVLSLSPELFYRKRGNQITMRPMKGTSRRGRTLEEDAQFAQQLRNSEKERAENLMIVDLLRSDLGKFCEAGSIHVTQALVVERYDTVLQMTSEIEGTVKAELSLLETMRALFPSGSVTGAPKMRTMQIIQRLEKSPRNIYTGCIGYVSKEETVFSVAIRTAVLRGDSLEMGVGSGVLHEADPAREYDECRLKGRFLTDPPLVFELIETILWLPETGYQRLSLHLDRLINSAEYFLIPLKREEVIQFLNQSVPASTVPARIRLLIDRTGAMQISTTEVESVIAPQIEWAERTVDSSDRFLFHKTTNRSLHESELTRARLNGSFDVIFLNEKGEVTEGALSNVWILKDGVYYTPPVASGLLDGTYRRFLLSAQNLRTEESVLFPADLEQADAIYISNAIRGLLRVQLKR